MMTDARWPLIASVVWLLFSCHVVVTQETVDMSAWKNEGHKMATCDCQGQRSNSLNEKHLQTIRSIIKDVREIYTDCSSQTDKVNSLKSQNKYLLSKVEHLEGDVTVLDKELQVLMHMRKQMPRDFPTADDVSDGTSGECELPLASKDNFVSQSPTSKLSFNQLNQMTLLNTTIVSLEERITHLEKINAIRRRKLRLLTKKNEQQGAALKSMERRMRSHVTKSGLIHQKHKFENESLEGRVSDLSRVVRKLERTIKGLVDGQRTVNRKYRQVVRNITRLQLS